MAPPPNIITELVKSKVVVKGTKGSKPTKDPKALQDAAAKGHVVRSEGEEDDAARRGAFDRRQEALVSLVHYRW
ncbi:hypothetical protein LTR56_015488 [Elasticomyces elasticus]|nr:hypothetical protein LTR56_015488 [Elasticomyces elasticus]KAK3662521.1 hypothetical protein LTR22_006587 [Elasticomyces elasticus]KAK4927865.1 hypothetical protein LTR49_005287 [Elasticomyces elasticus]KAK5750212.1 hypothetical protein LTS12_019701 [Elasticomyces elasticus]